MYEPEKEFVPCGQQFFEMGLFLSRCSLEAEHPDCSNGSNANTRIRSFHNLLV
jgi:hypothetical protein